ncbi:hypothetical protein LMJF_08_0580 [Leishmania major strain Friedlin]|uniref:Uncharacterized protein n=1 Tax=Leishmania major TaxID=5664 RepID=Q4QIB1_LEIMA|nr:hypothetical protein LMJF_08_0580 [Leishmania major strain Friedlin]CAG9569356.1 hypothetical_protein_-_conserved [Leishmania major strain Friedlin]CAJ02237.1 hypothetical protein LMJF_08_0580 [Leishmania major strain Friedlin]|eukprot:XP_001681087.1 hypothetical protein LMJF_08_0580 [Leishmania major strain Friedlin]
MTTPVPMDGTEVEFPSNSVVYQRVKHRLPAKSFFNTHWYTGIIIIVLVVLAAYMVLALWVCYHFEYSEQRKAKKVVAHAYVTNGFFDLGRGTTGLRAQRGRRSSSNSSERRTTVLNAHPSASRDEREETHIWHSGSDSTTTSESDEYVVLHVNPLQPQGVVLRTRAT